MHAAMDGINQTVFAYGQTSSGKTFTMKGNGDGLIPLSIMELFDKVKQQPGREFDISVSYIEIYNESVNDLIEPSNRNLDIRESISTGIYINRLSEKKVHSVEEVMGFMAKGDESRSIAATKLNELSSRGHTVFRINIKSHSKSDAELEGEEQEEASGKIKVSQLNLVDLAGSEGASKTQAEGIRLREG